MLQIRKEFIVKSHKNYVSFIRLGSEYVNLFFGKHKSLHNANFSPFVDFYLRHSLGPDSFEKSLRFHKNIFACKNRRQTRILNRKIKCYDCQIINNKLFIQFLKLHKYFLSMELMRERRMI